MHCALILIIGPLQSPATFTDLGVLPMGRTSRAAAVSADGAVVAGTSDSREGERAFRWTAPGGMQSLGTLSPGAYSAANALDGDGSVVVGASGFRAFRWTARTGMRVLGDLGGSLLDSASANGVSADGETVAITRTIWDLYGWDYPLRFDRVFRWREHGTAIEPLGTATGFVAFAMSSDGSIVVGGSTMSGSDYLQGAERWSDASGWQDLGAGGFLAWAAAVSADGSVVAGTGQSAGFRWAPSTGVQSLGFADPQAISGDGWVIAGHAWGSTGSYASLWIGAPGWVDLNAYLTGLGIDLGGWQLTEACGLSFDGSVIVGNGYFLGQPRAWRAGIPRPGVPFASFCSGDGTGIACPCGNDGQPGHGCDNSNATGGAVLSGSGEALLSADTLRLTASNESDSASSLFWQGTETPGRVFGDGVGCMGSPLKRLYSHGAVGGAVSAPQGSDLSISARSAALGDPITPGSMRVYHVLYRDPVASFCDLPRGSTFNTSNGLRVYWRD